MNIGDIVCVVGFKSLPESFLGRYGVVIDKIGYKVVVEFNHPVNRLGGLSHTAIESDLWKIGETNF